MAVFQLKKEQFIPAEKAEVWDFISSPANLKKITPPHMGFDITSGALPEKMYAGMIISYIVKPLMGIPMKWVTEITQVRTGDYFIDEQRVGPYSMWHHQHILEEVDGGVMMKDIVTYQPPLGILGRIMNKLVIARQLESIFSYRKKVIDQLFPTK